MILVVAGTVVSAISALTVVVTLIALMQSQRVRRRHGVPNPRFFHDGSGLVFGTLTFGIILGLSLILLARGV